MKRSAMRLGLLSLLVAGSVWAAPKPPAAPEPAVPPHLIQMIDKVSQGQLIVKKSFDVNPQFNGLLVAPKQGGREMIVFTDKPGNFLFFGTVVDAKGDNLTQTYYQKYVISDMASKAFAEIKQTHWFADGKDSAKHKLYVVIDLNCSFCHKQFEDLQPMVQRGDLQIRWVPVGFLKPDSAAKAAQLLKASSTQERVALLHRDEMGFNDKTEEGGIKPLKMDKSNPAVVQAFAAVDANNDFFARHGFQGTPAILFINGEGQPSLVGGYVPAAQIEKFLQDVSNHF